MKAKQFFLSGAACVAFASLAMAEAPLQISARQHGSRRPRHRLHDKRRRRR